MEYDDDKIEEIVSYNTLCDIVADQQEAEANGEQDTFAFREVLECKKVKPDDSDYKGSSWNVLVLWEDGSKTWEPLTLMAKNDPVTLAAFAKENNLLDTDGWKRFKKIARRAKVLYRMVKASKRNQKYNAVVTYDKFRRCEPYA